MRHRVAGGKTMRSRILLICRRNGFPVAITAKSLAMFDWQSSSQVMLCRSLSTTTQPPLSVRCYSVVVITRDFDSRNPGSNPGSTSTLTLLSVFCHVTLLFFSTMDARSAASSPSLTLSLSNSSSSPPQPTTPPPRQPRPRYPDLGRVPLHRRGTSKTYEHLEDLLREAGYKETRIFTPDSDSRVRDNDQDSDPSSKKQGVGAAVVGFLTGLVTGGNNSLTRTDSTQQVQSDDAGLLCTSTRPQTPPIDATPNPSNSNSKLHYHPSISASPPNQSRSSITRVPGRLPTLHHPSRAGNYLRHMVSTPSIPHACPHFQRNSCVSTDKPPLPRNWLDNVARAIIFGVAATGVTTTTSNHHQRTLRATRSSLSQTTLALSNKPNPRRSGLSDKTNTISAEPPALFTRLEKGRAPCSQGLLKAQVVCRSAPASRASSTVRGSNAGGRRGAGTRQPLKRYLKEDVDIEDKARGRQYHSNFKLKETKTKKADAGKPRVPSLARTRIEGDGWHTLRSRAPTPQIRINSATYFSSDSETSRFLSSSPSPSERRYARPSSGLSSGSGYVSTRRSHLLDSSSTSESAHDVSTDSDESDDDSDDEGELTLARMLVPPKRQHSIQSLRKHLHLHFISSPPPPPSSPPLSSRTACSSVNSEATIRPSLSRRPLYRSSSSSSTATLRSSRFVTSGGGRDGGGTPTVGSRVPSFSVAQSRLFDLVNSSCEKDSTTSSPSLPPSPTITTTTTAPAPTPTLTQRSRTSAGAGGAGGGREWDHERHKLRYSSRQSNSTETNNNKDKDKDNAPKPKPKAIENIKGKSRLGLPR